MKDIEMSRTKLTIYQGIYLFSKLAEAKIDINKLKIDNNDLSLVPPEYLSKGISAFLEPVLSVLTV